MSPLLRFALWTCPAEFRREYGVQIALDSAGPRWTRGGSRLAACASVIAAGMLLRIESASRNLAYGARSLARAPSYALVSAAAIALAIGANVTVAAVVNGVLLNPLPYADAAGLVYVSAHGPFPGPSWSYPAAHAYAAETRTIARLGLAADDNATLRGRGRPVRLTGKQVDEGYFAVLGVRPLLGRAIAAGDAGGHVAVLAEGTWRAYFGADPAVVGTRIDLDGVRTTVVGVMPAAFRDVGLGALQRSAYWIPDDVPARRVRVHGDAAAVARLRPGVSTAAAEAELRAFVAERERRLGPAATRTSRAPGSIVPLIDVVVGPVRQTLWLLYAAVDVLLLIAWANVGNLALVRAAVRERELAARAALGATRAHLAAQLSAESAIVALAGGLAGMVLGWSGLHALASAGARLLPRWEDVHVGAPVVAYGACLLVATALMGGVLPALAARRRPFAALKAGGRSGERSGSRRLRDALVVAELALAVAVVVSAGLIVRSFATLTHVSVGFDARNVLDVETGWVARGRTTRTAAVARLTRSLRAIPGVTDVAASATAAFGPETMFVPLNDPSQRGPRAAALMNVVTPEYFRTLRIPVLAGRGFSARDRTSSRQVALVNASFARRYFGTRNALGRAVSPHVDLGASSVDGPRTIVGVVGDVRVTLSAPPLPTVYVAMAQVPFPGAFTVRADRHDAGFATAIARAVTDDTGLAAPTIVSYDSLIADDAANARAATVLFTAFAVIALLLAISGIYAVTAYSVQQRTHEFGIRRAIGAQARDVLRDVVAAGLRQGLAGIALGIVAAAATTQLLGDLLFETSPLDPATFGGVVLLLASCTVIASLVPAVRATRVEPLAALRYE